MVYAEPHVKNYVKFVDKLFDKSKTGEYWYNLFLSNNSTKNKLLPKSILNYYKSHIKSHNDGKIIYINNNKKYNECIVLYGKNEYKNISLNFGSLISSKIENGSWKIYNKITNKSLREFLIGWGLDQYRFNKLIVNKRIIVADNFNISEIKNKLSAIFYGKELINIPSLDMGPEALEKSFINFADYHNADVTIIKGSIIKDKFPLIYAVGKASEEEPRLLEFNIGNKKHPLVIVIGKGVCFDTGGLDLKPSQYMRNMKKDMGGAASILSLAHI